MNTIDTLPSSNAYAAPRAPWARMFLVLSGLLSVYTAYRIYQHTTAFTVGLDYFSEDFQKYWMTLLYIQLPVLFALGAGIVGRAYARPQSGPAGARRGAASLLRAPRATDGVRHYRLPHRIAGHRG